MTMTAAIFYIAALVALVATGAVVLARNAVNAVLYLLVSLFAVALMFYGLGGPFVAIIEIIVYAGAIVVLFLFVIMMLNIARIEEQTDLRPPTRAQLALPVILAGLLAIDACIGIYAGAVGNISGAPISAAQIGTALYKQHYLGVELASLILLIGLIGGMHLGSAAWDAVEKEKESKSDGTR
jgi:NADH-quinone oxidoreductase subunit J